MHQRPLPLFGHDGRWVGPVTAQADGCVNTKGVLVVRGGSFVFDPFQSTIILNGILNEAGQLQGAAGKPAGQGGVALSITFKGFLTADGKGLKGALTSGACRWDVALSRG